VKESAERVNVFERQLLDLARGQSDALSASPSVRRRCHCAQRAAWYCTGTDRFGHSPAGMDAAKFHKVNEKIDLNDNKLREWVHSQRCVVEPPLQAVKCRPPNLSSPIAPRAHASRCASSRPHPNPNLRSARPSAPRKPQEGLEGVLHCFLTDRLSGLVWRRLQEQLSELRGTTVTQVAFAEAAQRIQALDEASRKLLEKVRPCGPSH
jgi:hypothetical protein